MMPDQVFIVLEYSRSLSPVLEAFRTMNEALERVKKLQSVSVSVWTDLVREEEDLWQTRSDTVSGNARVIEIWRQDLETKKAEKGS